MTDPDDVKRLRRYERLRDVLFTSDGCVLGSDDTTWMRLERALLAWKVQLALDAEQRRREKEAQNG